MPRKESGSTRELREVPPPPADAAINLDQTHEASAAAAAAAKTSTIDNDVEMLCIQEDYSDLEHESSANKSNFHADDDDEEEKAMMMLTTTKGERTKMNEHKARREVNHTEKSLRISVDSKSIPGGSSSSKGKLNSKIASIVEHKNSTTNNNIETKGRKDKSSRDRRDRREKDRDCSSKKEKESKRKSSPRRHRTEAAGDTKNNHRASSSSPPPPAPDTRSDRQHKPRSVKRDRLERGEREGRHESSRKKMKSQIDITGGSSKYK